MSKLGDRPRANRANVVGLITDGVKNRLATVKDFLIAAYPNRQTAALGASRSAANRGLQYGGGPGIGRAKDAAGECRGGGV